jgi:hypothetical protein
MILLNSCNTEFICFTSLNPVTIIFPLLKIKKVIFKQIHFTLHVHTPIPARNSLVSPTVPVQDKGGDSEGTSLELGLLNGYLYMNFTPEYV